MRRITMTMTDADWEQLKRETCKELAEAGEEWEGLTDSELAEMAMPVNVVDVQVTG